MFGRVRRPRGRGRGSSRCTRARAHASRAQAFRAPTPRSPTAYELSKKENKVGSPEKPLSDLGLLSYRSYWAWQITGVLRDIPESTAEVSVFDLVRATSIKTEDVVSTLQHLGYIRYAGGAPVIVAPRDAVDREFTRLNAKPGPVVDPARLHWAPFRDPTVKRDKWSIHALAQHAGAGVD